MSTSKSDDKKEKEEKMERPQLGSRVPLRQAAKDLAEIMGRGKKAVAYQELLSELQSGAVSAGLFLPIEDSLWIAIPMSHWATVASNEFSRLRRVKNRSSSATYKVSPREFAEQIAREISSRISGVDDQAKQAVIIERCFNILEHDLEVVIPGSTWGEFKTQYASRHAGSQLVLSDSEKAGRGRKQIPGWRIVNKVMAAYFSAKGIKSVGDEKVESIAANVLEIAKTLSDDPLPGHGSILKEVSSALDLIGSIRR